LIALAAIIAVAAAPLIPLSGRSHHYDEKVWYVSLEIFVSFNLVSIEFHSGAYRSVELSLTPGMILFSVSRASEMSWITL
jgi:hypothetical protein